MINIHEGHGTDIQKAIAEALQNITTVPSLLIYLVNGPELPITAYTIYEQYPHIPTMGIPTYLYCNGQVDAASIILLAFDDDTAVRCDIIHDLSHCPVQGILPLEHNIADISPGEDDTICLEFCTGNEETLITTLNAVLESRHIPLIGTTIYGDLFHTGYIIGYNGHIYEDSCVYAVIRNKKGRIRVYNENIYGLRPGSSMHIATKVDRSRKALVELDGQPAAHVYSEELHIPLPDVVANVMHNPLGRMLGNNLFTFSMREQLSDGTLLNFKQINLNDAIYFLELKDYPQISQKTLRRIRQETPQISFVFSIDCVYRYMLYASLGYLQTYAQNMHTLGPHVGITGAGEQYNTQHINQHMVCAVFEDKNMKVGEVI